MAGAVSDLAEMIRRMEPVRQPGVYVFASLPQGAAQPALAPIATMRESEGMTVVVEEEQAKHAGLDAVFRAAWITLAVHSDLRAVGLTAAFSAALARANIACNVIAGAHHDHIFVTVEAADAAMAALRALQSRGAPA
jgi:hypothetical protein